MVQSPNRSCQTIVDVNVTRAFHTTKILGSMQKRIPKHIQVDENVLSSRKGKVHKFTILHHCSQIMKQYFDKKI